MAGYYGHSKSNNAVRAEEEGKVVRSKITRAWLSDGGIDESPAFIKWLCKNSFISADEWHHTSKYFNEVDYYSVEGIKEELERLTTSGNIDALRRIYASKEARKLEGLDLHELFIFLIRGTTVSGNTEEVEAFVEELGL